MDMIRFIIPKERKSFRTDLPFYGKDAEGNTYSADGLSLLKNGRRFLPVMGEFHFTRYEPEFWREEILKMKAGGVDIAATYMFWIHHEEREDEWDFSGRRNIRRFLELCRECGILVWLRVGPWAHGECRNGGFPDWVEQDASFEKRVNDPKYLTLAGIWFRKIYEQVQGLFVKDGGPVIGLQIENEYGHCGGPADRKLQQAHIKRLYEMLRETGFDVPYYSATAWGGACTIGETLQVLSGYVDAPWEGNADPLPPKDNFRFIPYFDDADVGSDFEKENGGKGAIRRDYPYLTAELGGGMQVTSHRRPVAAPKDNEAAVLCALGSGANLIGYYMFHGGINPDGKYSNLNEAQDIGGNTNTPVKSYDFDALLNEAGKTSDSFGPLKKYALFMHGFGEDLAGAELVLPEEAPKAAADLKTVRAALRVNYDSGNAYLFINNHQRNAELASHPDTEIRITLPDGRVRQFSHLPFEAGECYLYLLNLNNSEGCLLKANPLTKLRRRTFYWIDGTDDRTEEGMQDYLMRRTCLSRDPEITVLPENQANCAYLFRDGLYVCRYPDSILTEDLGMLRLITPHKEESLTVYREDGSVESFSVFAGGEGETAAEVRISCADEEYGREGQLLYRDYDVKISYSDDIDANRLFLNVEYLGDRAEVYINGKLADDWFTTGKPWYILLDRFGRPEALRIRVYDSGNPMSCSFTKKVYYDLPLRPGCEILKAEITKEYQTEAIRETQF